MKRSNVRLLIVISCLWLVFSCESETDLPDDGLANTIDLSKAFLDDFPLTEVNYVEIEIEDPVITEADEATQGKIVVTLPATHENMNLSLKSVNFDTDKFKISPGVGEQISFTSMSVVYTITSLEEEEQSIKYQVSMQRAEADVPEGSISGFSFEKDKNGALEQNIESLRITDTPNAIYILVPNGTDITSLAPTIHYSGGTLGYRQGTNETTFSPWPTNTTPTFDFTSDFNTLTFSDRNQFYLSLSNTSNPGETKQYQVIVAYEQPIELEVNTVTSPVLTEGQNRRFQMNWTNKGNHPVQRNLRASNYVDNTNENGNIYTVYLDVSDPLQGGYILPGESGIVYIDVDTNGKEIGEYNVNIEFTPKYDVSRAYITDSDDDLNPIEDLFDKVVLNIKTTIE